jgi:DNA-directed RNA polymerase specialized sigma24 family protein
MEYSVAQVSRYLDRCSAPLRARKINGLLLLALSRALKRRASKINRIESIGGTSDFANRMADDIWCRRVEAQVDLERIVRRLSDRNSTVLALRWTGYEWNEISQLLGMSVTVVRNGFWREIRGLMRAGLASKAKSGRS